MMEMISYCAVFVILISANMLEASDGKTNQEIVKNVLWLLINLLDI